MKPTRLTQPYRKGARSPGAALDAMKRGRAANGANSADAKRAGYLIAAGKRVRAAGGGDKRPARPARPDRPPRPER